MNKYTIDIYIILLCEKFFTYSFFKIFKKYTNYIDYNI